MVAKSWLHKTFNGKIYNKHGTEPTKEGAESAVKRIRESGWSARYTRFNMAQRHGGGHFYIIWVRGERK